MDAIRAKTEATVAHNRAEAATTVAQAEKNANQALKKKRELDIDEKRLDVYQAIASNKQVVVTDATDDEISAAAAEGNTDRGVYWAHFGVGTAAYKSAIMAAGRFEADGVPTRTGRLGGDRWRYAEARVRTTDAEFGLEESGSSTSQSGLGQQHHGQQIFGAGY